MLAKATRYKHKLQAFSFVLPKQHDTANQIVNLNIKIAKVADELLSCAWATERLDLSKIFTIFGARIQGSVHIDPPHNSQPSRTEKKATTTITKSVNTY